MVRVVMKERSIVRENAEANGVEVTIADMMDGSRLSMLGLMRDGVRLTEGFTECALGDVDKLVVSRDWQGPGNIEHVGVEVIAK